LHFLPQDIFCNKMQPFHAATGHTGRKQQNSLQAFKEDSMTHLALMLAMSSLPYEQQGLWLFLSIGTVALFVVFIPTVSWIDSRRKEREAFYKAETFRRIAESTSEGAKAAVDLLREESRRNQLKTREGLKIGGVITLGVGLAMTLMILGQSSPNERGDAMVGLIPAFVGLAMLVYVFFLAAPVE
jgi:hypothetical protein